MRIIVLLISTLLTFNLFAADLNAYWSGAYQDEVSLTTKLKGAGFEVVGSHEVQGQKVIVVTNAELKKLAAMKMRGFMASWHFLLNTKDQKVTTRNPAYFFRAFMQKDYKDGMEKNLQASLEGVLGALEPSKDKLEDDDLADYRFMMAMPYYEDMEDVAEGKDEDLNKKIAANPNVVYTIKGDGYTLYGVKLSAETEGFIKKLGVEDRSLVLPYAVLVQGGEANILHAKYYLALSFPQLSMGEFMTISNIPGDIEDEIEAMFK